MLTCPMCKKPLKEIANECPTCKTDLSLLVGFVQNLEVGLARADKLTREGKLGDAVWSYLAVLEVDPDNAAAKEKVGQVAAAVRHFDRVAPSRRGGLSDRVWSNGIWLSILLALIALVVGFAAGRYAGE